MYKDTKIVIITLVMKEDHADNDKQQTRLHLLVEDSKRKDSFLWG